MKICRYDDNRVGLVQDDAVRDVTQVLEESAASPIRCRSTILSLRSWAH